MKFSGRKTNKQKKNETWSLVERKLKVVKLYGNIDDIRDKHCIETVETDENKDKNAFKMWFYEKFFQLVPGKRIEMNADLKIREKHPKWNDESWSYAMIPWRQKFD